MAKFRYTATELETIRRIKQAELEQEIKRLRREVAIDRVIAAQVEQARRIRAELDDPVLARIRELERDNARLRMLRGEQEDY